MLFISELNEEIAPILYLNKKSNDLKVLNVKVQVLENILICEFALYANKNIAAFTYSHLFSILMSS